MSLLPDDMKSGVGPTPTGGGGLVPPKPPTPAIPAPPVTPRPPSVAPAMAPKPPSAPAAAPQAFERPTFGGGLRVSLMPSEIGGKAAPDMRKQVIVLVLILVVETLLIGIAYLFLLRSVGSRTDESNALAAKKSELATVIKQQEETLREAATWNRQLKVAAATLDKHIYWTNAFKYIESVTLPSVSFKSFSGDADNGTVSMDMSARGYRDLAEQIVYLRSKPQILDVRTTAASAQVDSTGVVNGVSSSLVLKLDPSIWMYKK